jgi:hypothetical protein
MKRILFLIFYISIFTAYAQQWKWTYSNYGYGNGGAVAFDKSGNLFLSGSYNLFTEKFNPSGDSLWKKFIGSGFGGSHNMVIGPDTSIFLVGNGYLGTSSFVTKCDKEGNVIWNYSNSAGGQYAKNVAHSIAIDSQGNSYISGTYDSSATFGSCAFTNPNEGTFVVKLSSIGNCSWSMDIPNGGNYFSNVAIDHNDDLIISTPDSIIKVSNNQIQWVIPIKELNTIWHPTVSEVNTDYANNIYFVVGGDSIQVGQLTHKIMPYHGLLVKLTPSGSVLWMKEISAPGESIFIEQAIYLTGFYNTKIQKISLDGDSVWCRNLTSNNSYFNINNITGSDNGLIAITGMLDGILKDGNDTIIFKSNGMSPFVAVLEDTAFITNIKVTNKNELSFNIYPNPSSGIFEVHLGNKTSLTKISVNNLLGSCVLNKDCENEVSPKIDLSSQPKGIYFIEIVSGGER